MMTRDTFASVILRVTNKLPVALPPAATTKAHREMVAKVSTLDQVLSLRRLTEEFRAELERQGQSIEALNHKFSVLEEIPAIKTQLKEWRFRNDLANMGYHSGEINFIKRQQ